MAAFDRVKSGIPEMDKALDNIRLGDNVVWRVSYLSQFKLFMEPYIKQAIEDKRNIIYFRFASHEPLLEDRPEIKTIKIPLTHRFENFTVAIHNAIEKEGKDAFYVFDCLSDLQIAWATDLMMGNFFRVTCPFLFILDTVASCSKLLKGVLQMFVGYASLFESLSRINESHLTIDLLFVAVSLISTLPRYVAFPPRRAILLDIISLLVLRLFANSCRLISSTLLLKDT